MRYEEILWRICRRRLLGSPRRGRGDNIRMEFKEIACDYVTRKQLRWDLV
jgi:hypothetical protein